MDVVSADVEITDVIEEWRLLLPYVPVVSGVG